MSFWEMGGYAAYVWPSFGATAVIMIALLVLSVRSLRVRERTLRALEAARAEQAEDNTMSSPKGPT